MKKIKVDAKGAVITYTQSGSTEELTSDKKCVPHPDLVHALGALTLLMTEVFDMEDDNQEKFRIAGITLSQRKNIDQVIVTGVFETQTGMKTCLNTPNVVMDGDTYDAQENLATQIDQITDEAFKYLFENKQAQLDIETEGEKTGVPPNGDQELFGEESDQTENPEEEPEDVNK